MGKITGFMEYERVAEKAELPEHRITHYREFLQGLSHEKGQQQAARCMSCGIPFCHQACPINNLIPDFNDLVYRQGFDETRSKEAFNKLSQTNNFPEFTGRICPAPCEAACTLGINEKPVGIKSIERLIIDTAWQDGWVIPKPAALLTGKKVAVVGSGPAGLTVAQDLARMGHSVTVFERHEKVGGLLRYGIPDFKLEKYLIDRRVVQMEAEGVVFQTGIWVSDQLPIHCAEGDVPKLISPQTLQNSFDVVVLSIGAEKARDLNIPGRNLQGVHLALDFLIPQNKAVDLGTESPLNVKGKRVVVIGGGDTGADCVGTSHRQGAASVLQLELMPKPPEQENKPIVWPYWPLKLRTSSSHEEGGERDWAVSTVSFEGQNGCLSHLRVVRVDWQNGKMQTRPDSEMQIDADVVLLAMGFESPSSEVLSSFGVTKDNRGCVAAPTTGRLAYQSSVDGVFVAGDVRRGQSLVVWAIHEGKACARSVNQYLENKA
jgi:glutamate synthase (NADPH/NADH) small chain